MSPSTALMRDARYTWADYCSWPDDERWELIDGVAYAMAAAPSISHQKVVGRLYSRLERALVAGACEPFIAPTAIRLSDTDVVEPDILVVCDPAKVKASHVEGAPDLIVEVLSPGTAARDLRPKKALYERAGVKEYVVVDPLEHYAIRFVLIDDTYDRGTVVAWDEVLTFVTLAGVEVPLWEVFGLPDPVQSDGAAAGPAVP